MPKSPPESGKSLATPAAGPAHSGSTKADTTSLHFARKSCHLHSLPTQSCCSWVLSASPHHLHPFIFLTISPAGAQHGRYLCHPGIADGMGRQGEGAEKRVINTTNNNDVLSLVLSWMYYFFMMHYFPSSWMYPYNYYL